MKKLLFATAFTLLVATVSCKNDKNNTVSSSTEVAGKRALAENIITKNVGKYPVDIKMLEDAELSARLKKLMGSEYNEMVKNFNIVSTIKSENTIYKATGCKQNDCPGYSTTIFFDAENDNFNVLIDRDGKVSEFTEKGEITVSEDLKAG